MDWTCTGTTSEFRWWLKIDDAYNQLYQNRYFLKRRRVILGKRGGFGHRQPFGPKCGTGLLLSLALLVVIWLPLIILAASGSSTAQNLPIRSAVAVQLGTETPPLFQAGARVDGPLTPAQYASLQPAATASFLNRFPRESTALAAFNTASSTLWIPTPNSRAELTQRLGDANETVVLDFLYSFRRTARSNAAETSEGRARSILLPGDPVRQGLLAVLNANGGSVVINDTFPAHVVLDESEDAQPNDVSEALRMRVQVELTLETTGGTTFWTMTQLSSTLVGKGRAGGSSEGWVAKGNGQRREGY